MKHLKYPSLIVAAAVVVIAGAVWWWRTFAATSSSIPRSASQVAQTAPTASGAEGSKKKPRAAHRNEKKTGVQRKKTKRIFSLSMPVQPVKTVAREEVVDAFPDEEELRPAERVLVKRIRKALDADDVKAIRACADEAAKCANAEVRSGMVSALQWCGRSAMAELTMFMADADEDVRIEALDAWVDSLQEIESPTAKRDLLISSMSVLTDTDTLESLTTEIAELPNSYQIDIFNEVIEKGTRQAAEVAREEYETLTDEAYTTKGAAESWLKENPDDSVEVEDAIEKDAAEGVATPTTGGGGN